MNLVRAVIDRYRVGADPLRTQRRIELAALLVALWLCLQFGIAAVRLTLMAAPAAIAPAPDSVQVPAVRSPAAVDPESRDEIAARPLFWASRRPADDAGGQPQPEALASTARELEDVKLVGVFGNGDSAGIIALVKGTKRRILIGEELEGWTLESVGGNDGAFVRAGRRESLALEYAGVSSPGGGEVKGGAVPAPEKKSRGLSLGPRDLKN